MSQYFRIGERVLWNPSNGPANIFASLVRSVAEVVQSPSGMTELEPDEYEISLADFVRASQMIVRRFSSTSHQVFRGMLAGYLPICLVLIHRAEQDSLNEAGRGPSIDSSELVREVLRSCNEEDRESLLRTARDYHKFMPQ